jgi:hypothetical protein
LSSLEKISKLDIEILIMAHLHILKGAEARAHVSKSIEATRVFRERVRDALKEVHGDQEEAVKRIFHEDYEVRKIIWQERRPYLINLTAQVRTIAEGK